MKNKNMRFYLLFALAFLLSCNSRNDVGKQLIVSGDTLTINKKVYSLDSISKEVFNSVKNFDLIENEKESIDDTINVKRENLTLTFHLGNGSNLDLKNDTTEGYSDYVAYSYMESCRLIDYWLLKVQFYEGGQYLLIEKENGNKIGIWSKPIYSPNKKYFICYSFDIEAGYVSNGFQLFEIQNKKIKNVWSKEVSNWGPSDIRWLNDSIIYIEQTRLNLNNSSDSYIKSYKSMKIN